MITDYFNKNTDFKFTSKQIKVINNYMSRENIIQNLKIILKN